MDFVREEGCYIMVSGPQYETAGESRALKMLGADAVRKELHLRGGLMFFCFRWE